MSYCSERKFRVFLKDREIFVDGYSADLIPIPLSAGNGNGNSNGKPSHFSAFDLRRKQIQSEHVEHGQRYAADDGEGLGGDQSPGI